MEQTIDKPLSKKDFQSTQSVRWCPGCGDYAILSAVQKTLAVRGVKKENTVFVSGIGCSSRFPYYMSTYGFHTIHGRAPGVATGLKLARPELSVWVISGDGDALSIGAGHFLHLLRRNVNVNYLIFNNRIYGLTKGQYSPTSEQGKITGSSPWGSAERPLNPLALAQASGATFTARSIDRNVKHLEATLQAAMDHNGTSLIEIYQNCNIFNDGAFSTLTGRDSKDEASIFVEEGQKLLFAAGTKGIALIDGKATVVDAKHPEVLTHTNPSTPVLNAIYNEMSESSTLPTPFGVLHKHLQPSFENCLQLSSAQSPSVQSVINFAKNKNSDAHTPQLVNEKALTSLQMFLNDADTWTI